MKHIIRSVILLAFVSLAASIRTAAQPCALPVTKTWIAISNATGYKDTLWFGFDSTAMCGEDPGLCEISLAEPCGAPSTILCVWWSSPCWPGSSGDPLWRYDFRRYVSRTDVDTHRIGFQPGEAGYPLTFRWDRQVIGSLSDSTVLTYFSGGTYRQRMDLSDSLVITDEPIFQLRLFRYGQQLTTTYVDGVNKRLPSNFVLSQNYPNPFNPSTRISYQLTANSFVSLKVLNLLGQEVATLVTAEQEPGEHSGEWNADGLPSGVYIYRLTTAGATTAKKMLLLR